MAIESWEEFEEKLARLSALKQLLKECSMIYQFESKCSILEYAGVFDEHTTLGQKMEVCRQISYSEHLDLSCWYQAAIDRWMASNPPGDQTFLEYCRLQKGAS